MTNFEKVKEFNRSFGLDIPNRPPDDLFERTKLLNLRVDLIEEEVRELKEAIQNKDLVEVADALADILYVVYGAGIAFGIDLDKAFDLVHESNMSKLCSTEEQAKETVAWYKEQFLEKNSPYDSPAYGYNPKTKAYVVFNESTGKVLKNKYYKPVDLKTVVLS